jgi:signal transduction histidine kinase
MTIQLPPSSDSPPIFMVKDLKHDPHFSQLPFVEGGPHFRFYAGTPLTTKKGINVGSLCIMDIHPREALDQEQKHVMGWLAKLVITHLEVNREAMEGRRSKLMSDALNAFLDGRGRMKSSSSDGSGAESVHSERRARDRTPSKPGSRRSTTAGELDRATDSVEASVIPRDGDPAEVEDCSDDCQTSTKDRTTTSSDRSSDDEELGRTKQYEVSAESHRSTFARAANLLRECFQMEDGDGVFFLEGGAGLTHTTGSGLAMGNHSETEYEKATKLGQDDTCTSPTHQVGTSTSFDPLISAFTKSARDPAPVLAYSTQHEPFLRGQIPGGRAAHGEIDQDILRELFKRYPQGKIWLLENGAAASSSEEDRGGTDAHRRAPQRLKRSQRRRGEASIVAKLFPEVGQVLFVPLWDAGASRWASGCFMWSSSETRVFTATDLGFLSAFGQTIMAECSRLDTLLADKQKADFIGSISHELRSPLHGILAGAEFLTETATTAFQRSLIETVEACGRTLLDTINHVLDFSKINSLDRNWRNNRQPRKRLDQGQTGPGARMSAKQMPSGAPPLLRLYAMTDIAALTEEVVEGLSVGQIYSQATDLTDISAGNRGLGADKGLTIASGTHGGRQEGKQTTWDAIEVLLDIAKEDWVFLAQPGAIRRIIMNLFGK